MDFAECQSVLHDLYLETPDTYLEPLLEHWLLSNVDTGKDNVEPCVLCVPGEAPVDGGELPAEVTGWGEELDHEPGVRSDGRVQGRGRQFHDANLKQGTVGQKFC